jgi:SAM-dependent methyltransferase
LVTGIDYSEEMIRLASANVPERRFMVMDCREAWHIPEQFDGIVCGFILPYLSETELKSFIQILCNLLRNQGVAYISFVEGPPETSGPVKGSSGNSLYFHYHEPEIIIKKLKIN